MMSDLEISQHGLLELVDRLVQPGAAQASTYSFHFKRSKSYMNGDKEKYYRCELRQKVYIYIL